MIHFIIKRTLLLPPSDYDFIIFTGRRRTAENYPELFIIFEAKNLLRIVENEKAYSDFLEGSEMINKQDWFPLEELEL